MIYVVTFSSYLVSTNVQVYCHEKQFPSQQSRENALKLERRLTLVPVIFILVRIWGTIRFILYVSNSVKSNSTWWETAFLYLQVCSFLTVEGPFSYLMKYNEYSCCKL